MYYGNRLWDKFFFKGAAAMNGTLNDGSKTDQAGGVDLVLAELDITGHGLLAGSLIYIQGTTNFDGMRRIHSVDTNVINIDVTGDGYPSADETVASSDLWFPGVKYDTDWLFLGFKLHLDAASSTDEDLECLVDADKGSQFDVKIYDDSMLNVQDIIQIYEPAIPMAAEDIVKFTWANTNTKTWGLEVWAARMQA